jgi:hypothetical protein
VVLNVMNVQKEIISAIQENVRFLDTRIRNLVEIRLPKKFSALYIQTNLVTNTIKCIEYSANLKSVVIHERNV